MLKNGERTQHWYTQISLRILFDWLDKGRGPEEAVYAHTSTRCHIVTGSLVQHFYYVR